MLAALLVGGVSHHRALQSAPRQALDSTPVTGSERPVKIIVTDDRAYAPFSFLDPDGQPRGMTINFWKLWNQKTGIAVEFRLLEWDAALAAVREGQADVVGGLFRTPQREKIFDFTEPYFTIYIFTPCKEQWFGLRWTPLSRQLLAKFKVDTLRYRLTEWVCRHTPPQVFGH